MNRMKVILLVLAVLLLPAYAHTATLGNVRISFLEGDVQMRTTEAGDWSLLLSTRLWMKATSYGCRREEGWSSSSIPGPR